VSGSERAVAALGGLVGGLAAVGLMVWNYLRSCERYSERGFGEPRG
jgi:hypothetical protein